MTLGRPPEIAAVRNAWRGVVLTVIILACFGPALPQLVAAYSDETSALDDIFTSGFGTALFHSLTVAAAVILVSLAIGMPAGSDPLIFNAGNRTVPVQHFGNDRLHP